MYIWISAEEQFALHETKKMHMALGKERPYAPFSSELMTKGRGKMLYGRVSKKRQDVEQERAGC